MSPCAITRRRETRNATIPAYRERVCSILNMLQKSVGGIALNVLAKRADLPKPSAFRYLCTLEQPETSNAIRRPHSTVRGLGSLASMRDLKVLRERDRPGCRDFATSSGRPSISTLRTATQ